MGLASSQARLLNLTSRMHQIEYKAARLEALKLQMANESKQVYEDYLDALDKTKVQFKSLNADGSLTYFDIRDYNTDFLEQGFAIDFNGTVYDGTKGFALTENKSFYVDETPITVTADDIAANRYPGISTEGTYYRALTGNEYISESKVDTATEITLDFAKLCEDAFGATTPPATGQDVETVITNLINCGMVTIVQGERLIGGGWTFRHESDYDFVDWESSVPTNTGLREVTDEIELKKAEAKYEADMKRIDLKDRTFDTELAAIEAERNAIKQEMETLKTVSKDNVERTFKLFS